MHFAYGSGSCGRRRGAARQDASICKRATSLARGPSAVKSSRAVEIRKRIYLLLTVVEIETVAALTDHGLFRVLTVVLRDEGIVNGGCEHTHPAACDAVP